MPNPRVFFDITIGGQARTCENTSPWSFVSSCMSRLEYFDFDFWIQAILLFLLRNIMSSFMLGDALSASLSALFFEFLLETFAISVLNPINPNNFSSSTQNVWNWIDFSVQRVALLWSSLPTRSRRLRRFVCNLKPNFDPYVDLSFCVCGPELSRSLHWRERARQNGQTFAL